MKRLAAIASDTVGRPAKLFRFRHGVLAERAIAGTKLPAFSRLTSIMLRISSVSSGAHGEYKWPQRFPARFARTRCSMTRVSRVIPPIEWPAFAEDVDAILEPKRQRTPVLAQLPTPELHCVADIVGDSLCRRAGADRRCYASLCSPACTSWPRRQNF